MNHRSDYRREFDRLGIALPEPYSFDGIFMVVFVPTSDPTVPNEAALALCWMTAARALWLLMIARDCECNLEVIGSPATKVSSPDYHVAMLALLAAMPTPEKEPIT